MEVGRMIGGCVAAGLEYGVGAVQKAAALTMIGGTALAVSSPFLAIAGITGLALKTLGAPAVITYVGITIPLAIATPGLIVGSVSLIAAAFFASTGAVALSLSLPLLALFAAGI